VLLFGIHRAVGVFFIGDYLLSAVGQLV